jgi:hypothetical protein
VGDLVEFSREVLMVLLGLALWVLLRVELGGPLVLDVTGRVGWGWEACKRSWG